MTLPALFNFVVQLQAQPVTLDAGGVFFYPLHGLKQLCSAIV